jgi:hypothetical protein
VDAFPIDDAGQLTVRIDEDVACVKIVVMKYVRLETPSSSEKSPWEEVKKASYSALEFIGIHTGRAVPRVGSPFIGPQSQPCG